MALKPLALGLFDRLRKPVKPNDTVGVAGTAIWGGYVQSNEKNKDLASREARYKTFSDILANTSIVASGTRYFLNLAAKAHWTVTPSEADTDGRFAELTEQALMEDPVTPWHRIVKRAAMFRFYGFSIQEWTAIRRNDGVIVFKDIAPRAQATIDKWDVMEDGTVLGAIQTSPQTSRDIYLPRQKIMYIVDDSLNDSPEGLGLLRHVVGPSERLTRYEQLEGFGFETDLRGIPIGRGPFTAMAKLVEAGTLSNAQREQLEKPLQDFIKNHVKSAKTGMLLDSISYETKDEAGRASNVRQWDVELLKGSATSFAENANAIERLNREMARILGVEQLMLGSGSAGSFALSQDKTSAFFLLVDGALTEIAASVDMDLVDTLFRLNGWPMEMKPELGTEAIRSSDVAEVAIALRDMASAGAVLDPDDPVIADVREMLGVSPPIENTMAEEDQALTGKEDPETEVDDPEAEE